MDQERKKRNKKKKTSFRVRKIRALAKASNYQPQKFEDSSSSSSSKYSDTEVGENLAELRGAEENLEVAFEHAGVSFHTANDTVLATDPEEVHENSNNQTSQENNALPSEPEASSNSNDESIEDSNYSDSDETEEENEDLEDIQRLRQWAINSNTNQIDLDDLLLILRGRLLPDLPKSSKTFLSTKSAKYSIEAMTGFENASGEFAYLGIKKGLEACVDPTVVTDDNIELKFGIDGLSLNKSGDQCFWPILCKINFVPDIFKPFPFAIFYGTTKPASSEIYFQKFIEELNILLADGVKIFGHQYSLKIKCFVCDTPARAFCKHTLGHTAIFACERCTVEGIKKDLGSTVYPSTTSVPRTDANFRNQTYQDHHHGPSKLLDTTPLIDMISSFVLDFMHLCCLGVIKKLLEWWLTKDLTVRLRLRAKELLSNRMERLKSQVPSEFQRKPRSTKIFSKWKATELRFFLLYAGPVVLKIILIPRLY